MNIKVASKETNVSADTIRYYERIGLIPPVKRTENGVRDFDDEDLRWITFSRCMRDAGMPIEALIEYLQLFRMGDGTIQSRVDLLREQRNELQDRIDTMQSALDRLNYKIDNYRSHMVVAEKELKPFE
ncbi:MerR family transcriptional regulator [Sporolactobacillus kofuensis]|uniref:MerR family transcriptional regulator n=1 Tax=Sporolactobacillus kofuensis TaxID=269672 RepID=A0ABW1WEX0_9BACL|nr:MerR family transcriptional regulator [Sporolactobacillus kofuensis]MCO7176126.1 MerR family transcriptional regulator [Sporolactobacillus kofuensis]